ncbi:hypothetical protein A3Q56_03921 [Intoshia linei]|uniref:HECT-type E3 ubiquitin transferase n=1 Tax=Intoshia linei TaxID=1819745 RepID=A0A177B233_9BILA|nr:hypothetical protein A3Q56_03921 [Intoshia linei]
MMDLKRIFLPFPYLKIFICKVICGYSSTFIILADGNIYACGDNKYNKLGIMTIERSNFSLKKIELGSSLMISQICIGLENTYFKSFGGNLFVSGLMCQATSKCSMFLINKSTPGLKKIACGKKHLIGITKNGKVYVLGNSKYGQCGLEQDEITKLTLLKFKRKVVNITCGSNVSFLIDIEGNVFGFGQAVHGQFGLQKNKIFTPTLLTLPKFNNEPHQHVKWFGDMTSTFVTFSSTQNISLGNDFYMIDDSFVDNFNMKKKGSDVMIHNALLPFFTPFGFLYSFITPNNEGVLSHETNVVNLTKCKIILPQIFKNSDSTILKKLNVPIEHMITRVLDLPANFNMHFVFDIHQLFMVAPWMVYVENIKTMSYIWTKFTKYFGLIDVKTLKNWIKLENVVFLMKIVEISKMSLVQNLKDNRGHLNQDILFFLQKIFNINQKSNTLQPEAFYVDELKNLVDMASDYTNFLSNKNNTSYCNYPFLFNGILKVFLIQMYTSRLMNAAIRDNGFCYNSIADIFMPRTPFLLLNINRKKIVQDTFHYLNTYSANDLRRPLRIQFNNEEGIDEGGVLKEFFMLLIEELMDQKYGMFQEYNSGLRWFSFRTFEDFSSYFQIGTICALAIYNFTIVDLNFPLALYKKILNIEPSLEDLKELDPIFAKNLERLLSYDKPDFEDVFCLSFEIQHYVLGSIVSFELFPDGAKTSVTHENRHRYVDLYMQFLFSTGVDFAYVPFKRGFLKCFPPDLLNMFQPTELRAFICGNAQYDWNLFRQNCQYKDYPSGHITIQIFWNVFNSYTEKDKIKFLKFLTGSTRISIYGMKYFTFTIQYVGDVNRFPVAHTCFNILDLPPYRTFDILKKKLSIAISETEGFGVV